MATTLEELQRQLDMSGYTAKTDEQIASEAQNKYKSLYEQQKLSAKQQAEATDLGLQQQLNQLGTSYDRQMEEARKATQNAMSQFDRYSLGRGMQRSSYNAASLANLNAQGNKTLNDIQQNRTDQEGNIAAQRALAQEQLAAQLAQLDTGYASDVQAAIDALREQEYERNLNSQQYKNDLLMQLYQLGQSEEDNALKTDYQRLQNQLLQLQIQNYGKKSGGSGRGGTGGNGDTGTTGTDTATTGVGDENVKDNNGLLGYLNMFSGMYGDTSRNVNEKNNVNEGVGSTRTTASGGRIGAGEYIRNNTGRVGAGEYAGGKSARVGAGEEIRRRARSR